MTHEFVSLLEGLLCLPAKSMEKIPGARHLELERAVEILNPSGGAVSALLCKEDQNEDRQSYKMSPSSLLV